MFPPCALEMQRLTLAQAERNPDEEGDYMAFEQLMAEGMAKKGKDKKKDKRKSKWEGESAASASTSQQ